MPEVLAAQAFAHVRVRVFAEGGEPVAARAGPVAQPSSGEDQLDGEQSGDRPVERAEVVGDGECRVQFVRAQRGWSSPYDFHR
ncbi:hypothetical protein ACFQ0O_24150 [Saccharopolyspora spinosporotrichia]